MNLTSVVKIDTPIIVALPKGWSLQDELSKWEMDEEAFAKELFLTCEYPNPETWEETEGWNREVWKTRANIILSRSSEWILRKDGK